MRRQKGFLPSCLMGHRVLRFGSERRLLDVVCKRLLEHWGHNSGVETASVRLF